MVVNALCLVSKIFFFFFFKGLTELVMKEICREGGVAMAYRVGSICFSHLSFIIKKQVPNLIKGETYYRKKINRGMGVGEAFL